MDRAKRRALKDLSHRADFPWRLRVLMALADIRAGELSSESGVCMKTIYHTRAGLIMPKPQTREKLLSAIEDWQPGVLDMMLAAERRRARYLIKQ